MTSSTPLASHHLALNALLERYSQSAQIQSLRPGLDEILGQAVDGQSNANILAFYDRAIPVIEQQIWSSDIVDDSFTLYQQMFREMEACIALNDDDDRYEFVIIIPVADRPQHLSSCLASVRQLCELFNYGGRQQGQYKKLTLLIADDSKHQESIASNKAIAQSYDQHGLQVIYFGIDEQLQQINSLTAAELQQLNSIVGDHDPAAFYHKGASNMRNIAYLKLNDLVRADKKQLFYFIDSDQEFKVKVSTQQGDLDLYAVNFLYYLDRIFKESSTSILTGKVVGDPPVSPSVMAGNFLEDVICFLTRLAGFSASQPCQFHDVNQAKVDDASYHDMADLFGFAPSVESYQYRCAVAGGHDHVQCLQDFANKLSHFFDGAHPTRKTYFEYEDVLGQLKPARTIYTGNYIFRPEMLTYFVPFATLKLRMAGPVLGRLIKSELDDKFVSANLPMLHKRTVDELGQSEFRPGVEREQDKIDLSSEFERQFYGDVMLFTVDKLTLQGYPEKQLPETLVEQVLAETETTLRQQYEVKHKQIINKLASLTSIFSSGESWWNNIAEPGPARGQVQQFINNIQHNFGVDASAYRLIDEPENRNRRQQQIVQSIMHYTTDRALWQEILSKS